MIKFPESLRMTAMRVACHLGLALGLWIGQMHAAWSDVPPVEIAQSPLLNAAGSMSGVAPGNLTLAGGGSFIYQPGFSVDKWSGTLKKLSIGIADEGGVQLATVPDWDAADILSGKAGVPPLPLPENRSLYTGSATNVSGMVEFRWDLLAPAQRAALDASPVDGISDGLGARRVAFLRGARSDELGQPQGKFRVRDGVLGDIVNSNVVHVGPPAAAGGGIDYRQFYEARKNRVRAVYVGANDGMLHAFDAQDGVELFAYIPQLLIGELNRLSGSDYVHRPYVDGAIAVAEAQVRGKWKTLLAAGLGGGAQGVFVLDVSDPADFKGGAGVLWEFSDRDDADMGNVFNVPVIARFRTGRVKEGAPEYRHFIVVASGLNNYLPDGYANPLAPAVLFLLSVDKARDEPWQLGLNYFKFKKPLFDASLSNGLSSPGLVMGADGAVHYAYAGDMQGNLWRFDFTGNLPWAKENVGSSPLFTALDVKGQRQPITTRPRVVFAPGGGYVVLFGTGKLFEADDVDPASFSIQSFYAIYDPVKKSYMVTGRSQLEQRILSRGADDALKFAGKEFVYSDAVDGKRGWYFDFLASDDTGERSVSNPLVDSGRLLFNSLIPCAVPCSGGGRSYMLHALSGLPEGAAGSGVLSQVGMLTAPVLIEVSAATSSRNVFGKAIVQRKSAVIHAGSGGAKGSLTAGQGAGGGLIEAALPAMRFSWREILNWQELRLAAKRK